MATDQPLRADQIQDPDNPVRMLAESHESSLADKVRAALSVLAAGLGGAAIFSAYGRRDKGAIFAVVFGDNGLFDSFDAALQPARDQIRDIMDTMASVEAEQIAPGFRYDPAFQGRLQVIQAVQDGVLADFEAKARTTLDQVYTRAAAQNMDAEAFGRLLTETGALAPQQAAAVMNYRNLLDNGDAAALRRTLRDQKYDRLIREARQGAALTPEQKDAAVSRYADRYLDHRAKTIAGDTAIKAASRAARSAWEEAAAKGVIRYSDVTRFWETAGDELVCPKCRAVPLLNPHGIGLNDQYKTLDGYADGPGLHGNCRCSERYETRPPVGRNTLRIST